MICLTRTIRRVIRRVIPIACGTVLVLGGIHGSAQGAAEQSAHDVVLASSEALMAVVADGRAYYDADPERYFVAVHDVLSPVVDFERIAKSVMGREHFRSASPEQLQRFVEVFRWGLVRAYAGALIGFGQDRMEVVPDRRPPEYPNRRYVNMRIQADGGKVYAVMYTMIKATDGYWRMANLTVEGVDLGMGYRSQFQRAMEELRDMDRVIDTWTQRITNDEIEIGE